MGNLVKSIKNVGKSMNGIEPVGKVVTEVLRSLGATATGQAINGHTIADVINDFADKLSAEPIEEPANGLTSYGKIVNAIKRLGIAMNGEEPDGKLISKVLKNLGEDATKTTINGYAIADILNDIADKWIHLSLTVQPVAGNVTEFGKLVSDLQSNIAIGSNAITGTLHYVTGYTGFSSNPAEQSGHYIALKATASEPATITAQVIGGTHGAVTLDSAGEIVCRIASNAQSIRFIAKAQEETFTVEYALTNLALAYNVSASVTNGTASGAQTINKNGTASVTLAANSGYTLPANITVVGSDYTYDSTTGVVTLSDPTVNVDITAVCEAEQPVSSLTPFDDSGSQYITGIQADTSKSVAEVVTMLENITTWEGEQEQSTGLVEVGSGYVLMAIRQPNGHDGTMYAIMANGNTVIFLSEAVDGLGAAGWQNLTDGIISLGQSAGIVTSVVDSAHWNDGSILGAVAGEAPQGLTPFESNQSITGIDFGNVANGDTSSDLDNFLASLSYSGTDPTVIMTTNDNEIFATHYGTAYILSVDSDNPVYLYSTEAIVEAGITEGYQNLTNGKYSFASTETVNTITDTTPPTWNGVLIGAVVSE